MANKSFNLHPQQLSLADGTELRLCPLERTHGKPLYCSADGRFFNHKGRELRPSVLRQRTWRSHNGISGSHYPSMRQYGNCHILIALTWIGPRPTAINPLTGESVCYECHHRNGDMYDNRASNLIWLSRDDHRRYDAALRTALRHGLNLAGDVYEGE